MSMLVLATAAAGASLLSLATGGVLYTRVQGQERALQSRFDHVVTTYARAAEVGTETVGGRRATPRRSVVITALARVFAYKPAEPHLYPVKWWLIGLLALAPSRLVVWLIATLAGDGAMLASPVIWVLVCRGMFGWMERRYTQKLLEQFPDALGMIVRAVRAGVPVNVSIQSVAEQAPPETAREFQRGAEQLALGASLEDAITEMARLSRLTEYRFFATALSLQAQTGGGLSETLEGLAEVIRKRVAMRARGSALSSEAKTSAGILAALPILTGALLLVISPDYAQALFIDPGGKKLLAVAVGLLGGGILLMRHLIRKSLS